MMNFLSYILILTCLVAAVVSAIVFRNGPPLVSKCLSMVIVVIISNILMTAINSLDYGIAFANISGAFSISPSISGLARGLDAETSMKSSHISKPYEELYREGGSWLADKEKSRGEQF